MHLYPARSQRLGVIDWGSLLQTGIQAGTALASKTIEKNIAKQRAGIEAQQIALANKQQEIELTKLRNQNLLAQRRLEMEAAAQAASPLSAAAKALFSPVSIPGMGNIPLTYIVIPAGILLAVLLMRKRK